MTTSNDNFARNTPAPARLRVRRVEQGETIRFRTLSAGYGGLFTHYIRGNSRYCFGTERCPPAIHKDKIWKGYAGAEYWLELEKRWRACVWEITQNCEQELRGLFSRGQVWRCTSRLNAKGSGHAVTCELVDQLDPASLRSCPNILPTLFVLYNTIEVTLDEKNPLPARELVEDVAGDGPKDLRAGSQEQPATDEQWKRLKDALQGIGPMPATNGRPERK